LKEIYKSVLLEINIEKRALNNKALQNKERN